jgi:hypothetical protein
MRHPAAPSALQFALALPQILALPAERPTASEKQRVQFAFQMMHGTLNMALINPGPFSLQHPNTVPMLTTAMCNLIEGPS